MVEIVGEATGFDMLGLLNPVVGDHEKVALGAFVKAFRFAEAPEQIVVEFLPPMLSVEREISLTRVLIDPS